jgi:2-polyprenyl-6-methoxyphenol hydroxylase-like FAD-dependent oxidoreductase
VKPKRILIVGAGIGGLSLAIALKQKGIKATIVERAPELKAVGAGIILGANAMAVLKQLGWLGQLQQPLAVSARNSFLRVLPEQSGKRQMKQLLATGPLRLA